MNRLIILAFVGLLAAGCWSSPPHSTYFIVTFAPGTPQPSPQGALALANLTDAAGHPTEVLIVAKAPAGDTAATEVARQRADLIARSLVKAGVNGDIVTTDIRTVDDKAALMGKDDLTVQLAYGTKPEE